VYATLSYGFRFRFLSSLLLALCAATAWAQSTPEQTQQQLQKARNELRDTQKAREQLEREREQAANELRRLDQHVAHSGQALAQTQAALEEQQQALAELQQQRARLETDLAAQRQQLANLLRSAYQLGQHAGLKLLLSPDVSQSNRNRVYYRYVQQQRQHALGTLVEELQALVNNEQHIAQLQQELALIEHAQQEQIAALAENRQQRAQAVKALDQRYQNRQQRERNLQANVRELERVLTRLQQKAAAARRAANAAAAANRANAANSTKSTHNTSVVSRAPAPQVGGLGWPLSGQLLARYGARLPDGRNSSGVLIGAAPGSPINAVADGQVVYADWMNGYGMILIIDHGNNYLSLYAHNDTLLRRTGERVQRGQAVATVGNSGGQGVSALYFELRRNGQAVDPVPWLQRR